jgi:hypothetical protein
MGKPSTAPQRRLTDFEKNRILAALPLRPDKDATHVLRKIESATQRFWMEALAAFHWESGEIVERKGKLSLKLKKLPHKSRGRPPKEGGATRRYVTSIVAIYRAATGCEITRIVRSGSDPLSGRERRHPFIVACLRAAGIPSYPTGIVREVVEES